MASDRRTLLADAALDVLADEGIRGLTHRAVDRRAAMPPGTTSAYFRTRTALLTALVTRLVQLDQAELHTTAEGLLPLRTAEDLVNGMALLIRQRLTGEGRRRSLARYACAVESVRDPELREILVPRENAGHEAVRLFLGAHGVTDVENRTHTLLTCVDGLVFDRLVSGGEVQREALEGLVAAALRDAP
ncbi:MULTISPECIES: TetR/AcrR family transcriptional regulator [Streptomyces]|uniref:TetR family transcriptional regulator C-terminal domain-containing protein n=1 Tax=Streptomyces caniscabiei TaxID=2746961 RepID=A0ABU4MWC6_9ACTN|nr:MULTISPECIES: TetR family transcriptional regulator C-terminal domain-containing protein [Streptomyces]MBE4734667.1 TetR/AcrR family transcriptional regulator [Streptomyces caniscabiei]MBE4755538.1 TetR/AcrR family transcriptional regulator [Streptomyces caniscabiei]MBE4772338.1 TetR/AcrR family transcriptional regulator [Streptomyces caniscabiei]MBE4783178.1 TetR/AcrR family transcriptional regulator [Streptomyces caniscabiei]MBE4792482.1 TetR/AcrR family transcriptional regulator [Strepto